MDEREKNRDVPSHSWVSIPMMLSSLHFNFVRHQGVDGCLSPSTFCSHGCRKESGHFCDFGTCEIMRRFRGDKRDFRDESKPAGDGVCDGAEHIEPLPDFTDRSIIPEASKLSRSIGFVVVAPPPPPANADGVPPLPLPPLGDPTSLEEDEGDEPP